MKRLIKKKRIFIYHSTVHYTPSFENGNREEEIEDISSDIVVDIVDYMWILHCKTNY